MARIRTISEAAAWVREKDPETALTPTALRRLVTSGMLPSVRVGMKYLLNLDVLEEYLRGSVPAPVAEVQGVRRVQL